MADNETTQSTTPATLPAGVTFGFDDVDGVKIARSKTGFGVDGSYTDVSSSDPLPVEDAAAAALLGTIDTDTGAIATALAVVDDWDESDRAKVNPIVGQAGVQGGSGTVSANTQRVVLATDVALPAGTNAIGKLAANSGVDIGDVDVTSTVPPTAGTATLANVAGSASSVTLIASNANRKGAVIVNDSAATLYIKFGSSASATSFTYVLPGSGSLLVPAVWEMPAGTVYTGIITGIWGSATGSARCTELT